MKLDLVIFASEQAQPVPPTAEERSTAFRPIEGGAAMQSGEKLLVEAYAAIWLIVFALILFSFRRQRAIDERIAGLEAAIARARAEQDKASRDRGD